MGPVCPAVLKTWLSWIQNGVLLRLLGLPAALLALHLEIYGHSAPATASLIHRLSERLRLTSLLYLSQSCAASRRPASLSLTLPKRSLSLSARKTPVRPGPPHRHSSSWAPQQRSIMTPDVNTVAGSGAGPAPRSSTTTTMTTTTTPSTPAARFPPDTPSAFSTATTSSTLVDPSPRPSMNSHARSKSHGDILRQGKRLSLQFPVQPGPGSTSPGTSPPGRPQSYIGPSSATSATTTAADASSSSPENSLLATLAAHERYVLELKEELLKAEADLKTLKKHFANQEAYKQRNDIRKMTQLQPINTALANHGAQDPDDEDGSSQWLQREMERKKALISGTKTSQRKVFSGSKHLRTLSLLSPDKAYVHSFPQPLDLHEPASGDVVEGPRPAALPRHHTSPDLHKQRSNTINGDRFDLAGLPNLQRDAILRTGKQMATELKDGFLTFIEDIRQATVGEESAAGDDAGAATAKATIKGARKPSDARPTLQRQASTNTTKPKKTGETGDDFWKEHGLVDSKPKAAPKKPQASKTAAASSAAAKTTATPKKAGDFDDWDNWDTPNDKHAEAKDASSEEDTSSEEEGAFSPRSGQASSRTSTSSAGLSEIAALRDPKRNPIPWPDLVKLSPGQLKRTASHLMKEWEKNMTPPPESRSAGIVSGDYIGRTPSPATPSQR